MGYHFKLKHIWRIIYNIFNEYMVNFFGWRRRVTSDKKLNGQVVVITGANTGIGKETAYQLTLREAKVYILCRDLKKGEAAVNDILSLNPKANIKLLSLDLSSLKSVRKCVEELSGLETKVDILINNAGVALCPEWTTADGFEMQFGTNHLGHFLFTLHLIPMLKNAPAARIITVSSGIHLFGQIHLDNVNLRNGTYNPFFSYAQSKLANVLFSRELAKRLRYSNISTYSLTPGVVNTDLSRHVGTSEPREGSVSTESGWLKRRFFLTPLMGSQTTLYCALDDKLANESGFYYKLLSLDLSSLTSVRKCVEELSDLETKVDILINNAGVMACPEWQTEDGFEMQFGTNHLGHFLLTMHLLPLLRSSPAARIINVSSSMHLMGEINLDNINLQHGVYDPTKAYAQSKLANVLFTRELAKRLDKTNVNIYSLNPGAISTDLQRHTTFSDGFFKRNFFLKPCLGSQTTLYCALDESVANESGFYYESVIVEINCHRVDSMVAEAMDDSTARKLWSLSVDLSAIPLTTKEDLKAYGRRVAIHSILAAIVMITAGVIIYLGTFDNGKYHDKTRINLTDAGAQLKYVCRHQTPALLWLFLSMLWVISKRIGTRAMIPCSGSEDLTELAKMHFLNTLEQFIM
ncbi:unnamed protein product, partial [Medioppia subpectinata]